jgi:NAD(P)-dependent dehydrogenase (short-subunit alcohol dehydrogenase family)
MKLDGSTALVTGANRGLGRSLVRLLREAGCKKVYAGAREPAALAEAGLEIPVLLDITNPEHVTAAAVQCHDVDLLINNAGVAKFTPLLAAPAMDNARIEMDTNYFGTLAMCRAFAPVLKRNGGGALVNVLSVVSWFNAPMQGSYCASKAAEWSLTRAARFELRSQGTLVVGVHAGYIDTDMSAALTLAKTSPDEIARRILEGIETRDEEILADQRARTLRAQLLGDDGPFETAMQHTWDSYRSRG